MIALDYQRQSVGVARHAERACEHVRVAERERRDRRSARIGESVHDLVERAVAAGGDNAIDLALAFRGVAARVARRARREELDSVAAPERADERVVRA